MLTSETEILLLVKYTLSRCGNGAVRSFSVKAIRSGQEEDQRSFRAALSLRSGGLRVCQR